MKATTQQILSSLPPQLAHRKSLWGVMQIWKTVRADVCSPRTLGGLPPFAEHLATALWAVEPAHVVEAVRLGDPAFFVAILLRLDQLDESAKKHGKSISDRSSIYRARYAVDGFLQAAAKFLREKGGTWPPGSLPEAQPTRAL